MASSRSLRLLAALCSLALLVAACGDDDVDSGAGGDATSTTTTESTTTTTAPPTTTTTTTTAPPTTTSTTAAPTTTTTAPPAEVVTIGRIELSATGIGDAVGSFGDEAESVLLEVAADMAGAGIGGIEGSPSNDTGWFEDTNEVSPCNGTTIRKVNWEDFELVLRRDGDGDTFMGWHIGVAGATTGLTTPEGIGVGSTAPEVEAVYGPDAFGDEGVYTQIWVSDDNFPAIRGITDQPGDAGVTIQMDAGNACLGIAS